MESQRGSPRHTALIDVPPHAPIAPDLAPIRQARVSHPLKRGFGVANHAKMRSRTQQAIEFTAGTPPGQFSSFDLTPIVIQWTESLHSKDRNRPARPGVREGGVVWQDEGVKSKNSMLRASAPMPLMDRERWAGPICRWKWDAWQLRKPWDGRGTPGWR